MKPSTVQLHEAIRKEYNKLSKHNKYKEDYIYKTLADKFFKSPKTIENIVFDRVAKSIPKNSEKSKAELAERCIELFDKGLTRLEICSILNKKLSKNTLINYLCELKDIDKLDAVKLYNERMLGKNDTKAGIAA